MSEGISLASQIRFIQNMILAAFTMAGSILGAQYWGKGDKKTIQSLFHLMLRWAGAVSSGKDYIRPNVRRLLTGSKQLSADFRRQCLPLLGGSLFWVPSSFTGRCFLCTPAPAWTRWARSPG